jgi:CheY-like chemotaxis protein
MAFNPAGITRHRGEHLSANMTLILPKAEFSLQSSTTQAGGTIGGGNGGSNIGKGSTVHLFLPHADMPEVVLPSQEEMSGMPTGNEYIFVIEDDAEVRIMVEKFITQLGCRVVSAASAEEVYSGLDEHGKPDLFLSDVVLPAGHRGPKIIAGVHRQLGPVKAIFMSGHADGGVAHDLNQGVVLINKPFELAYLARQIRQALDGPTD